MDIVLQPYAITMARHSLNLHETRIFIRVIAALQQEMRYASSPAQVAATRISHTAVTLPTKSLLLNGSKNHAVVRKALRSITRKGIEIKVGGNLEIFTNLLLRAEFRPGSEIVEVEIDKALLPYFLGLARNYTKFSAKVALECASARSSRIYQYICHWADHSKVLLSISLMRSWLGLQGKYQKPAELRKWVLEPVEKDLRARSDTYFEIFGVKKGGRKIVGFWLKIYQINGPRANNSPILMQLEEVSKRKRRLQEKFQLSEQQANKLTALVAKGKVPKNELKALLTSLEYDLADRRVVNPAAWLLKTIEARYGAKI